MAANLRRRFSALATALALAISGAAVAAAAARPASAPMAPLNFKLRTTDGGEITSEMVRGDVVVLAFGSTQLGSLAKAQVQGLQELANEFGERDVRVYWVSTESDSPKSKTYASDAQLSAFARKNGLKIAVLRDPEGALFKQTGSDQLPSVVLLDRRGEVSGSPIGGHDPNSKLVDLLSKRLNDLLAQQQ